MRKAEINRKTEETGVKVKIDLDAKSVDNNKIDTGVGFLDHMLTLLLKNAGIGAEVKAVGDTYVDFHHTTEDVGITLGQAVSKALGDKKGIVRYSSVVIPMDESLVMTALDISGRGALYSDVKFPTEKIGNFDTELVEEFFDAFSKNAGFTLHIRQMSGKNSHHLAECCYKSVGRAIREAIGIDKRFSESIPSTKGTL